MDILRRSRSITFKQQLIRLVPVAVAVLAILAFAITSWDGARSTAFNVYATCKSSVIGQGTCEDDTNVLENKVISQKTNVHENEVASNAAETEVAIAKPAHVKRWNTNLKALAIEVGGSLFLQFFGLSLFSRLGSITKLLKIRGLGNLRLNKFLSLKRLSFSFAWVKRTPLYRVALRIVRRVTKRTKSTAKYLFRNRDSFSGLTEFGNLVDVKDNDDQDESPSNIRGHNKA